MCNDKPNQTVEEATTYTYCVRCGKRLHSEEAKMRGMGKKCWEKSQTEKNKLRKLF